MHCLSHHWHRGQCLMVNKAPTKNDQRIAVLWSQYLPERIIVRLANHNHKHGANEIQFAACWVNSGNQGASGDTTHAHGGHVGLISSYR